MLTHSSYSILLLCKHRCTSGKWCERGCCTHAARFDSGHARTLEREKDLDKKVRWQTKQIKRRHIPCFHDLALQYALILWWCEIGLSNTRQSGMQASQHVCAPAIADPVDIFLSQPHCLAALLLTRIRQAQAPVPLQLVVFARRQCGCRVKIVTASEPVTQLASPRVLRASPARAHCVTQINKFVRV